MELSKAESIALHARATDLARRMYEVFRREFPSYEHAETMLALLILLCKLDRAQRDLVKRKPLDPEEDTELFMQMVRAVYFVERNYPGMAARE